MPFVAYRVVVWRIQTQSQMMRELAIVDWEIGHQLWIRMRQQYPTAIHGLTGEEAIWWPENMVFSVEMWGEWDMGRVG